MHCEASVSELCSGCCCIGHASDNYCRVGRVLFVNTFIAVHVKNKVVLTRGHMLLSHKSYSCNHSHSESECS